MVRTNVSVLLPLLLASCTSFDFGQQIIELRHSPERDTLEARILYSGVDSGEAKLETAREAVRSVATGGPPVIVFGWPWEFDPRMRDSEDGFESDAERRAWNWAVGYEVVDAGALIDDEGKLGLWQEVRWPDVATGLEVMNGLVSASYAEGARQAAPFEGDPDSRGRFARAAADPEFRWIAFDDSGALRVSVPATPRDLAELVRGLPALVEVLDAKALDPLHAIEVRDDVVTFVFAPAEDGWIRFSVRWKQAVYEDELSSALRASPPTDEPLFAEPPAWVTSLLE